MTSQTKPFAFAGIAERLGKLIPRLASDHDGEVVATVLAIGRTLQGAGLDWHDLAERTAHPSLDDAFARKGPPAPPASTSPPPSPFSEPERPSWSPAMEAEFQASRKPKKEPPPWPTWGTLSHFGRIGQLDAIKAAGCIPAEDGERFAAFHADYYRHQIPPGRKTINLFNAACRSLWEMGARSEEAA